MVLSISRIDRISVNIPMAELRHFQYHARTIGSVGDRSVPGDHIPVRLAIECPRVKHQDHPVIQRWLAQHPLFVSALGEEDLNMMYDEDPFIAMNQVKEVAFRACSNAREAILTDTGAKLLVACTALRCSETA